MNHKSQIIIIRCHPTLPIGIDRYAQAFHLHTAKPLRRACYDGRLVFLLGKQQVGYHTLKHTPPVRIVLSAPLPF